MAEYQLRAQTILYKNDLNAVKKSVVSIANAVKNSANNNGYVKKIEIAFGDASPESIVDKNFIDSLNSDFGEYINVSYQFFGFNSGTSKGQNILFKDCKTEYLMIYNPDIVVAPDYFLTMMKKYLMDKTSNIGMIEARQTPIEHPKNYNPSTGEELWGAMACVIIPSAVYRELGGLDEENFFMYCDDVDFSWRVRLSGRKIMYSPNSPVFHGHRLDSFGKLVASEAERYYSAESALLMAYKWSNEKRLKNLIAICSKGDKYQKKALEYFNKRRNEGTLPKQLDKNHRIASFTIDGYSQNRY